MPTGLDGLLYCHHCVTETGQLKPFETVIENVVRFLRSDGTPGDEAEIAARRYLRSLPAWRVLSDADS